MSKHATQENERQRLAGLSWFLATRAEVYRQTADILDAVRCDHPNPEMARAVARAELEAQIQAPLPDRRRTRPVLFVLIGAAIALTGVLTWVLLPFFLPSATVTLIPASRAVAFQATITGIAARPLPALTLSQTIIVQATGTGHHDARAAHGSIMLYNAATYAQTIAAQTVLVSAGGVQIVLDQAATIPGANPPIEGQAVVPAHAALPGPAGNLPAYALDGPCCAANVYVKNLTAFTGGQDARTFSVLTAQDEQSARARLDQSVQQGTQAVLQAQMMHPGEALAVSWPCQATMTSSPRVGEEATTATVSMTATCQAAAYPQAELQQRANALAVQTVTTQQGPNYVLSSDVQVTIQQSQMQQGTVTLTVQCKGTAFYQVTPGALERFAHLIAGKSKAEATALLAQQPGIQQAGVTVSLWGTVPSDPARIHFDVIGF